MKLRLLTRIIEHTSLVAEAVAKVAFVDPKLIVDGTRAELRDHFVEFASINDRLAESGKVVWSALLSEHVSEVMSTTDPVALRFALERLAGTTIAWIDHLDQRQGKQ